MFTVDYITLINLLYLFSKLTHLLDTFTADYITSINLLIFSFKLTILLKFE